MMIADCGYVLLSSVLNLIVYWNCVMSLFVMISILIRFVRVRCVVDVVTVVAVIVDVVSVVDCFVVMIWRTDCCLRICGWVISIFLLLGWLCF